MTNHLDPNGHIDPICADPDDQDDALAELGAHMPVQDPTRDPTVDHLPAVQTAMTPDQFRQWIASDGQLFVVYLPGGKSFVMKVPDQHNAFFVAMMQQVKFQLGDQVQAVRMNIVTGPPADIDAGTGTTRDAPAWAQPPTGAAHIVHDDEPAAGQCSGSRQPALPSTITIAPRGQERGRCAECNREYRLTYDRDLRAHPKPVI